VYLGFSDYTTKNRNRFVSNVVVQKSPGEKLIRLVKDEFTLAEAQQKLPDLYRGNLEVDPLLDVKGDDVVGLKAGSPCLDAGAALTVTTADGQGVDVPVEDPLYFCDGFGLIDGDRIVVGANAAAKLVKVDYEKRVLTLDRAITWKKGDAVNLPYAGQGPDIGPFEAGAAGGEGAAAASGQDTSEAKVPTNKETEMAKAGAAKAGGPRKIIVGSCMYSMWGPFPGFDERLKQMGGLIDDMVKKAKEKYGPDAQLDLAALPEYCITSGKKGPAKDRCVPLEGPVLDYFGAKAREHKTYIVVAMELADDAAHGGCTNAAVLIDRAGKLVGIYRKVHAVANVGDTSLEGGMAPGTETPVFQCDFGKVGMQICYDIGYDDGWAALAKQGAELVVWPTQSPQTIQPAARALTHGYYIVSSTWRNNASLFDPTGAVIAQITKPEERVLVERIDLSYALLP
ncbi:MAG TPA: carbon-nitrogen hydrolase family protein, partial [Vicinamibacterales bacterium]|nr:carbon-nitrogen hydrolase family protein [Vicinamibacterales bacterium]